MAFNDGEKLDGFFKEGVLHGFARCDDGDDDVGAETSTERERKQSSCLTGASSQDY